jgi:hypothetical protein
MGGNINGKNLIAVRISHPDEALSCHILFISASEDGRLEEVLGTLGRAAVLTVSDMPRFTERGGMIQFTLQRKRVRFEVNLGVSADAGLLLSSDLLKLAIRVKTKDHPGD